MMEKKQPDALRLADVLEKEHLHTITVDMDAAAELRRLHDENERLKAERDELLAAAKKLLKELEVLRDSDPEEEYWGPVNDADDALIAVIAKVEGRTCA